MSPATKSKSKDKRAGKDVQKALPKPSGFTAANSSVPASAYNPLLRTFQTLELGPTSTGLPLQSNGRFRNIDETDGVECDSLSNNGSWSGDSEDHKDKTSSPPVRQETIPGADNDKREKIRQKNERKHQRQKERRAQELHERCSGYLMSRKLESLAQQLVSMGISHERATMALILNEGRLEQSISWLFDEDNEGEKQIDMAPGNLKIDISEELNRITEMEIRYKCLKQEVERAVVAEEGDLDRAEETLRAHIKQDQPSTAQKPEESGDSPAASNGKNTVGIASQSSAVRPQMKPVSSPLIQQKRDEKEFNYTKASAVSGAGLSDSVNTIAQPAKRIHPKLEWAKQQQNVVLAEKRWSSAGSNPTMSYSLASPVQLAPQPAKSEIHFGNEFKNVQHPSIREPAIMMPMPLNMQASASTISSSPPGTATSWYPATSVETLRSNGFIPQISTSRIPSPNITSSNQMLQQLHQQHLAYAKSLGDSPGPSRGNVQWSRATTSPTLAPASSLGLFSGLGSNGSSGASSPVDWSTGGSSIQLDYTSIDWSLDRSVCSPQSNRLWLASPLSAKNSLKYDPNMNVFSAKPSMRLAPKSNGIPNGRLNNSDSSMAGSREWTSPFEGKDLFSVPRRFVSSPPL